MKLETTEVGLQVYNGSNLSGHYELTNGQFLIPYSGIALEPQYWPDSPNRNFPSSSVLIPGSTYEQHTKFSLYIIKNYFSAIITILVAFFLTIFSFESSIF